MRTPGIVRPRWLAHNSCMERRARRGWFELAACSVLAWTAACTGGQTGHNSSLDCGESTTRELSFDEAAEEGFDVRQLLPQTDGGTEWHEEELKVQAPVTLWTSRGLDVPDDRVVDALLRTRLRGLVTLRSSESCAAQGFVPTDVEIEIADVEAVLAGDGQIAAAKKDGAVVEVITELTVDEIGHCVIERDRSRLICEHE